MEKLRSLKRTNITDIPNHKVYLSNSKDIKLKKEVKQFIFGIIGTLFSSFLITISASIYKVNSDVAVLKHLIEERKSDIEEIRTEIHRLEDIIK